MCPSRLRPGTAHCRFAAVTGEGKQEARVWEDGVNIGEGWEGGRRVGTAGQKNAESRRGPRACRLWAWRA